MKKMNLKNLFSLVMLLLMFLMAGAVAFAAEAGTSYDDDPQDPPAPYMTPADLTPTNPVPPPKDPALDIDKVVDGDKLPEEEKDKEFSFIYDENGNKIELKDGESKPLDNLKPGQITIKEDPDKAKVDGYTQVGVKYEVSWEKTNTVDKNGTLNLKIPGEEGKEDDTGKLVSIKPDIPAELEGDLKAGVTYTYTVKDANGNPVTDENGNPIEITLTGEEVKNGKTLDISLKPGEYKIDMKVEGGPNEGEGFMVFVGDEQKAKDTLELEEDASLKDLVDKIDALQTADKANLSDAVTGLIDTVANGNGNGGVQYDSNDGTEQPDSVTMTIVKYDGEAGRTYTYEILVTRDGTTGAPEKIEIKVDDAGYGVGKYEAGNLKNTTYTIEIRELNNAIADSSTVKSEGEFSKEFTGEDVADNFLEFELENNMVAHITVTNTYEKDPEEPETPPTEPEVPQTPQTPTPEEPQLPEEPEVPETDTIPEPEVPLTTMDETDEPEENTEIPEENVPLADATPETGDASLTALWAGLAAVSAVGMGAMVLLPRKKEEQEK